jgi:uncharacterized phage protein (TIGR01671 family)
MRNIKFRAWDKKLKAWVVKGFHVFGEVTLFNVIGSYCYETKDERGSLDRYNDIEVTEFTSLSDKNRKEIYEGDIVKVHDHPTGVNSGVGQVVFNNGCFEVEGSLMLTIPLKEYGTAWTEVIGNIYENPELIS